MPSFSGGGAERVVLNLLRGLYNRGYPVEIIVFNKSGPLLTLLPVGVPIHDLGTITLRYSIVSLVKKLQQLKPKIVFSTLGMVSTSALCSFFLPKKIRFIARLGNTISADLDRVKKESYIKYLAQSVYYNMVIRTSEIVTQSQYMKNDLIDIYPFTKKRKVHQIYNPVEFYDNKNDNKSEESVIQFITVGRFAWQKGYDYLIKAFQKVLKEHSNVKLTFVGTGILEDEMKALAKELNILNDIEFAGHQNDPFKYIKNPDIFVSSSRFEGFSNVIIESLANGIPVVATDCPSGNREVITQGENGWLSSMKGDIIDNLADTIDLSIKEYHNLNMKAQQTKIMNKLNVNTIVKQYENLFLGIYDE